MTDYIDPNNPQCAEAAYAILTRHNNAEAEANITSAVRDFLILARLAKPEEITEENPPSDSSRRAVDLTALDTFVEMKTRIGPGGEPHAPYVEQLDDYLTQSQEQGRVRMGILTDGKYWLLRWPGAGPVKTVRPYAFTLEDSNQWYTLYEWLRDEALVSLENIPPDRKSIADHFGTDSPSYQRDIDALAAMYREYSGNETIKVKRRLWHDLLRTALGEVAGINMEMDDLFVRHTYLTAVIGMVVQAYFGIDIRQMAETDPADLLEGREFRSKTGLQGVVESDFFAWPAEVGGHPLLKTVARRAAKFDWRQAPTDIGAILYETVIPADERRTLGEYYTPAWLARSIVRELVDDPLDQSVLDPACGSGTFVAESVTYFIDRSRRKRPRLNPRERLYKLQQAISGIDVHPVAVHLARAAWVLAAQPAIQAAVGHGFGSNITVPIYLGDALQLRTRSTGMFSDDLVTIPVDRPPEEGGAAAFGEGIEALELAFPVSLVERPEDFDAFIGDVAEAIEHDDDPYFALDDHNITNDGERTVLENTIAVLQKLHADGRDHIWAYYTRNLVRPVTLALKKVDVIVGNPPWINYNQTIDILRIELERQSKDQYGIWQGGRYATHQDVAGLFYSRCVDLYLKEGGLIGMVMPHSALQTGQYAKWRTGAWSTRRRLQTLSVDFGVKTAWDLEQLEPNNFFPIPASVVFAKRLSTAQKASPLAGSVELWLGRAGAEHIIRESVAITDTSAGGDSPYGGYSRQGAVIVPRCLFFVTKTENTAVIQAGQTVTVDPRRGSQDKEPWRSLDLPAITGQTIEKAHVFNVHLGETIVPYATLDPLKAILPLKQGDARLPTDIKGTAGIRLSGLERRMRTRWQTVSRLWEENKGPHNKLNLLNQLDYIHKLSAQLEWMREAGGRPVRLAYSSSGQPTAAILHEDALVDYTLFWTPCKDIQEAYYLLAIINSQALYNAVSPLMPKGLFGARHLQKHLWKLPIPAFNHRNRQHTAIAQAGQVAAEGAALQLAKLRQAPGPKLTVTVARRELRAWLRASAEGQAVEKGVGRLLRGG